MNYAGRSLDDVVAQMRALGIIRLHAEGLDVTLGPAPARPAEVSKPSQDEGRALGLEMPPDDDLLMWSTGGPLPSEERTAAASAQEAADGS